MGNGGVKGQHPAAAQNDAALEGPPPLARARCFALGDDSWVVGLTLGAAHPTRARQTPTRFHFVLDNSGSMGHNTENARVCFSQLVELANGPCSLTVFDAGAQVLGQTFRTVAAMREVALPRQGQTNITAGVEAALKIIRECEESTDEQVHHVLVLLSDGAHNSGPRPEERLPGLGAALRSAAPALRLSVVVVGVSGSSDTSMGMLLRQSVETVALPALEPIYFAHTPQMMNEVLGQLHGALASLRGSLVSVCAASGCRFVRGIGEPAAPRVDLLAEAGELVLLCVGSTLPPEQLNVDGVSVPCAAENFDGDLAGGMLQALVDDLRVRRVAFGADRVRPALELLGGLISEYEARMYEQRAATASTELSLAKATPTARVTQHKALKRATQGARELRNQLAEIQAHRANDSASQAAFLVGAHAKYSAKTLRRASAHRDMDPESRLEELLADVARVAPKMRRALRLDLCDKLNSMAGGARQRLHERLVAELPLTMRRAIDALCSGCVTEEHLAADAEMTDLVDSGAIIEPMLAVTLGARRSYLSLQTAWEQLKEWCDAAPEASATCGTEYQLLMFFGAMGYPIDVQRREATQMDPFAMDVTRVRASLVDTASLCTALQSDQVVVPPEGGVPVQDVLVLVDPDVPRASRLAASSMLLREAYTSVVLCRDLHMYTGSKMRLALHAHALLAALRPPPPAEARGDLAAQLRRQYLGRAFQCAQCGFGPIDHFACEDLASHHGEEVRGGAVINNGCPSCAWFSADLAEWPRWDGKVPDSALDRASVAASPEAARPTAAALEIALRICYSARVLREHVADGESCLWMDGEARLLCQRMADWESLTAADGVEHPVQLLLALAVCDDVPDGALGPVSVLSLLNEVFARHARNELRKSAGTDESAVMTAARRKVSAFLGVTEESAPRAAPLTEPEPERCAVAEACRGDCDPTTEAFDYKAWLRDLSSPWAPAIHFVRRLRAILASRGGGWPQLARDMEAGPSAYGDVISALQEAPRGQDSLRALLGVESQRDAPRVLATIVAQAFLHNRSQQRRVSSEGGALREPLGDVRASETLRQLCVDLRMAKYEERVAAKMREWGRLGASISFQRARVADLCQYSAMCGSHVHGLDGPTFWGLWRAAKGENREKALVFLKTANHHFAEKYGSDGREGGA